MRTIIATIESNKSGIDQIFMPIVGLCGIGASVVEHLGLLTGAFFLFLPRESGSSQSIGER